MKRMAHKFYVTNKILVTMSILMVCNMSDALAQRRNIGGQTRHTTQQNRRSVTPKNRNTNSGNRVNNNNVKAGNNNNNTVNINVNKNRNVNVNNHNAVVRTNTYRPYTRPPYTYGGRSFYSYHPYVYHPYHPFYWGPVYHPWGAFVATVAATAIIVSVADHQYHYDQGIYYAPSNGGYTVVQAPVGAVVTTIPSNAQTVVVNETTNNYYYAGTFYEKSSKGYTVVPPTAGTIVTSLPEGGKEVKVGSVTYVQLGETYYQPIQQNGKDVYEVVKVETAK